MFVELPWVVRGYRYGNGVGGGMAVCGVGKYFLIRIFNRTILSHYFGTTLSDKYRQIELGIKFCFSGKTKIKQNEHLKKY